MTEKNSSQECRLKDIKQKIKKCTSITKKKEKEA